jgi:peptide-methionine (R)-S-oxide reductase
MMHKSEEAWKQELTPAQFEVLRKKGTEPPFSGKYIVPDDDGVYACAACGQVLFSTRSQYESTLPGLQGWPSFAEVIDSGSVDLVEDLSMGIRRTEVVCGKCGGHLGHLFDDHTSPNGKHYCINSVALNFSASPKK